MPDDYISVRIRRIIAEAHLLNEMANQHESDKLGALSERLHSVAKDLEDYRDAMRRPFRGLYPPNWPKCPACGDDALDGHLTCGRVECDEGGRNA